MRYMILMAALLVTPLASASCSDDGKAIWLKYAAANPTTRTQFWITDAEDTALQCYRRTFILSRPPFEVHRGKFGMPPKPGVFMIVTKGAKPY